MSTTYISLPNPEPVFFDPGNGDAAIVHGYSTEIIDDDAQVVRITTAAANAGVGIVAGPEPFGPILDVVPVLQPDLLAELMAYIDTKIASGGSGGGASQGELVNYVTASGAGVVPIANPLTSGKTINAITLTGNCSFSTPTITDDVAVAATVMLTQGGVSGGYTPAISGMVAGWIGGGVPPVNPALGAVTMFDIFTLGNSGPWYGVGEGAGVAFVDNGDGTVTITGSAVTDNGDGTYTVNVSGELLYSQAGADAKFRATAPTTSRPSAITAGIGAMIYETTLHVPLWSDGATWRDATGTAR